MEYVSRDNSNGNKSAFSVKNGIGDKDSFIESKEVMTKIDSLAHKINSAKKNNSISKLSDWHIFRKISRFFNLELTRFSISDLSNRDDTKNADKEIYNSVKESLTKISDLKTKVESKKKDFIAKKIDAAGLQAAIVALAEATNAMTRVRKSLEGTKIELCLEDQVNIDDTLNGLSKSVVAFANQLFNSELTSLQPNEKATFVKLANLLNIKDVKANVFTSNVLIDFKYLINLEKFFPAEVTVDDIKIIRTSISLTPKQQNQMTYINDLLTKHSNSKNYRDNDKNHFSDHFVLGLIRIDNQEKCSPFDKLVDSINDITDNEKKGKCIKQLTSIMNGDDTDIRRAALQKILTKVSETNNTPSNVADNNNTPSIAGIRKVTYQKILTKVSETNNTPSNVADNNNTTSIADIINNNFELYNNDVKKNKQEAEIEKQPEDLRSNLKKLYNTINYYTDRHLLSLNRFNERDCIYILESIVSGESDDIKKIVLEWMASQIPNSEESVLSIFKSGEAINKDLAIFKKKLVNDIIKNAKDFVTNEGDDRKIVNNFIENCERISWKINFVNHGSLNNIEIFNLDENKEIDSTEKMDLITHYVKNLNLGLGHESIDKWSRIIQAVCTQGTLSDIGPQFGLPLTWQDSLSTHQIKRTEKNSHIDVSILEVDNDSQIVKKVQISINVPIELEKNATDSENKSSVTEIDSHLEYQLSFNLSFDESDQLQAEIIKRKFVSKSDKMKSII